MVTNMTVNIKMTKEMAKEFAITRMVTNMTVNGKMVSKMAKEFIMTRILNKKNEFYR